MHIVALAGFGFNVDARGVKREDFVVVVVVGNTSSSVCGLEGAEAVVVERRRQMKCASSASSFANSGRSSSLISATGDGYIRVVV